MAPFLTRTRTKPDGAMGRGMAAGQGFVRGARIGQSRGVRYSPTVLGSVFASSTESGLAAEGWKKG